MRQFGLICVVCLCLLAGCDLGGGASTSSTTAGTSPTDTVAPSITDTPGGSDATATPDMSITPTPTGFIVPTPKGCNHHFPTDGQFGYIGDVLISQPHFGGLSYLGLKLPDTLTAGQPYHETAQTSTVAFTGGVTSNPSPQVLAVAGLSNGAPALGVNASGFVVTICNSSATQTHTLQGLGMQIVSFVANTASKPNVQVGCDRAVSAKQGPISGCGGSSGAVDGFTAGWPSGASVGTTVNLAQKSNTQQQTGGYANLPVKLAPGAIYTAYIGMTYPGRAGTYTFQFGMQVDANSLATVGGSSYPLFLSATLQAWSGGSCWSNPTWKQLVLASTSGYYICPTP